MWTTYPTRWHSRVLSGQYAVRKKDFEGELVSNLKLRLLGMGVEMSCEIHRGEASVVEERSQDQQSLGVMLLLLNSHSELKTGPKRRKSSINKNLLFGKCP
ncbi:hypothetical protein ACFX2A_020482 [Malus domestica]